VREADGLIATLSVTGTVEDETTFKGQAVARTTGEGTDMGAEGTFVATRRPEPETPGKPEKPEKPE
jgi:hypothetical protein